MLIVAHRGDSEFYPENTLIAFEAAIEAGADVIELDVHMTSDSYLVVHHDYYLGRSDDGVGKIYEQPVSYIKALDAGSWFNPRFKGQEIPLLAEVLSCFRGATRFELELKGFDSNFIREVSSLVDEFNLWDAIEFTSAPNYLISRFKQEFPAARVGIFIPAPAPWMDIELGQKLAIENLTLGNIDVGHLPLELLTGEFVELLRTRGIIVHVANCDLAADIQRARDLRADQLSTNSLHRAIELIKT